MAFTTYPKSKDGEQAKILRKKAGVYLKALREQADLTQAELARLIGVEYYTFISQVETGLARVPPDALPMWANALNVDLPEFTRKLLEFYDPHTHRALFGEAK